MMTKKDLFKKLQHYHDDMPIVIVPENDDREDSQVMMTEKMWDRARLKTANGGSKSIAILCVPFGIDELC